MLVSERVLPHQSLVRQINIEWGGDGGAGGRGRGVKKHKWLITKRMDAVSQDVLHTIVAANDPTSSYDLLVAFQYF